MRKTLMLCTLTASVAMAAPFQLGDVFASVGDGKVKVFRPNGTLVQTLDTTLPGVFTTGGAFDAAGNFYVTTFNGGTVSKFNNNGVLLGNTVSGLTSNPESIAFDASGNFYVGSADGDRDVRKYTSAGVLLDQFDVGTDGRGSDWVDLAANQSTLYYTSEGSTVFRYDVGSDSQLTSFATGLASPLFALRILGDGRVLVAGRGGAKLLDTSGNVIRTYTDGGATGEIFSANVDPDGTTFWTGDLSSGTIFRFNIETGALVSSFNSTPFSSLAGLTVFGEKRVAPPDDDVVIPEPTSMALLGSGLSGLICMARRRRRLG